MDEYKFDPETIDEEIEEVTESDPEEQAQPTPP
jgi:hypothetical protein